MSSYKVFAKELDKTVLNSGILDYHSIVAADINNSVLFCKRSNIGFVNNACDNNKLLFINPIIHFAKFQKFFNNEEIFNIQRLIDELN